MGDKFTEKLTNDQDENVPFEIYDLLEKIKNRLSQKRQNDLGKLLRRGVFDVFRENYKELAQVMTLKNQKQKETVPGKETIG